MLTMFRDAFPALLALTSGPQPLAGWVLLGPCALIEAAFVAAPALVLLDELRRAFGR